MIDRVGRALRRGTLAGSLMFAITGGVGLAGATPALAASDYTITRFAGTGTAGGPQAGPALSSPLGFVIAAGLDPSGNLYIADPQASMVEKVTPDGTLSIFAGTGQNGAPTPGPATSSTLNIPVGVAADSAGNVYIADQNNHAIEKVAPDGNLTVFAGIPGQNGPPTAGPATASRLHDPDGIAVDSAGNVYIADYSNAVIEKVTPGGTLSIIAGIAGAPGNPTPGPATSSHLSEADGVAVDTDGNVYIADGGPNVIEKVTPGGTLSIVAGISGSSASPTPGPATASALDDPIGVGVDSTGAVYVADQGADVIEKIAPDGILSVIAGNGTRGHPSYGGVATATTLDQPAGMAVDPAGNLYVADALNFTIDRLTPSAPVSTTAPMVTGSPASGQTLSTDGGSWDNAPFTRSYQWQDCDGSGTGCTSITGATSRTYTVTDADRGHTLRVVVTATNGGGPSATGSAATTQVPDDATGPDPAPPTPDPPTPDPTPTSTPPATNAVLATTTRAAPAGSLTATLTGEVSPSTTPFAYGFEYGTDASYGTTTRSQTAAGSNETQAVRADIRGLVPGTVYHYRLVATTPSGTSYGHDMTLATPRAKVAAVHDHVTPARQARAPYRFRVYGGMAMPRGLTRAVACRSGGTATVAVTRAGTLLTARRVPLSRDCTYAQTFVFTGRQLPGHGRLVFHVSFNGNRQLMARDARSLGVRFG